MRMEVPNLLHYACIPDLSQIATKKKECQTVVVANSLEVWGCPLIKCRRSCLVVQEIFSDKSQDCRGNFFSHQI
jgi:hypothetical protein